MKNNWVRNFFGCFLLPLVITLVAVHYCVFHRGEIFFGVIGVGIFWLYFLFCGIFSIRWQTFLIMVIAINGIPLALVHIAGFTYAGIGIFIVLLILQFLQSKRWVIILNSILLLLASAGMSGFILLCYSFGKAFDSSPPLSPQYLLGIFLPISLSVLAIILRFAILFKCKKPKQKPLFSKPT